MKQVCKFLLACALGIWSGSAGAKESEAGQVRKMIDKVNQHWQAENSPEVRSFWDNAVYHTGNMEAYFLTGNRRIALIRKHGQTTISGKEPRVTTVRNGNTPTGNRMNMYFSATIRFASRRMWIYTTWLRRIGKSVVPVR